MGLAVLVDLEKEISKLIISGSNSVNENYNLIKISESLFDIIDKSPVIEKIYYKLKELSSIDESNARVRNLLELNVLVKAVVRGISDTAFKVAEILEEKNFSETELICKFNSNKIICINYFLFTLRNKKQVRHIKKLMEANQLDDIRLYRKFIFIIKNRSNPITRYIENFVINKIGYDIIPFLLDQFDIFGGREDAKLFSMLYKILGKDILPLSEEILNINQPDQNTADKKVKKKSKYKIDMQCQAIETLVFSDEYIPYLEEYAQYKNKKIQLSALKTISVLSKKYDLKKSIVYFSNLINSADDMRQLKPAILLNKDKIVSDKIYQLLEEYSKDISNNVNKYKYTLNLLIEKKDLSNVDLLCESTLNYLRRYKDKKHALSNELYYLNTSLKKLLESDDKQEIKIAHVLSEKIINSDLNVNALYIVEIFLIAIGKLKGPEKFYDVALEILKHHKYNMNDDYFAYVLYNLYIPEDHYITSGFINRPEYRIENKTWDRRWSTYFAKRYYDDYKCSSQNLNIAYNFIYDDDTKAWDLLFNIIIDRISERYARNPKLIIDLASYPESPYRFILYHYFEINPTKAILYYNKFVSLNFRYFKDMPEEMKKRVNI